MLKEILISGKRFVNNDRFIILKNLINKCVKINGQKMLRGLFHFQKKSNRTDLQLNFPFILRIDEKN